MARTTEAQVRSIMRLGDIPLNVPLDAYIETATNLVDRLYAGGVISGPSLLPAYSNATLELIERWLAGHFTFIAHTRSADERAGSVGESFQYKLGLNLQVTIYGQQALVLDLGGPLADAVKAMDGAIPNKVGVWWLGNRNDRGNARIVEEIDQQI